MEKSKRGGRYGSHEYEVEDIANLLKNLLYIDV
jgi:hypothetical protein